jgi:hypothetical protein
LWKETAFLCFFSCLLRRTVIGREFAWSWNDFVETGKNDPILMSSTWPRNIIPRRINCITCRLTDGGWFILFLSDFFSFEDHLSICRLLQEIEHKKIMTQFETIDLTEQQKK